MCVTNSSPRLRIRHIAVVFISTRVVSRVAESLLAGRDRTLEETNGCENTPVSGEHSKPPEASDSEDRRYLQFIGLVPVYNLSPTVKFRARFVL